MVMTQRVIVLWSHDKGKICAGHSEMSQYCFDEPRSYCKMTTICRTGPVWKYRLRVDTETVLHGGVTRRTNLVPCYEHSLHHTYHVVSLTRIAFKDMVGPSKSRMHESCRAWPVSRTCHRFSFQSTRESLPTLIKYFAPRVELST